MNTNKMNAYIADLSPNKTARIAGLFYLLYIVANIIADLIGHFGFGDAAAIVKTMMAPESLFVIGFLVFFVSVLLFLLAAWALYALLKPVHKNFALLFLLLNLVGVAIQSFSILNLLAGRLLFSGADYLKVIPADQLQGLAMLFVNLFKNGYIMAQLFYGAWLLPLGYLVFKSGFLPKVLGILLMADFVTELIWFFQFFLLPDYPIIHYPGIAISFLAEVGLTLWLLIKGVKDHKPALIEAI
jgi:hypothetical protein